jgi:ATP-dependent Zn protease
MNSRAKIAIICAVLIGVAGVLWVAITGQRSLTTVTYSQFLERVRTGQIAGAILMAGNSGGTEAICRLKEGTEVRTVLPSDYRDALLAMLDNQVNIEIRGSAAGTLPLFMKASPFLLLLGVWIFLMIRKLPNAPGQNIPG